MSPHGRPKDSYRSAQHEGTPVNPPVRASRRCPSARRDGTAAAGRGLARRELLVAVGAVAAVAGATLAWWRARPAGPGPGPAPQPAVDALWNLRLPRPGGGELALASLRGSPLLLNFWATWCPPCIREMPLIDRFAREFAVNGWQVLGIAVDQDKPVLEFLARNPVGYPIALAGFEGIALSRQLGNDSGALPFTVALDAAGRVAHRHLGEVRFEQIAGWAGRPRTP
ncbi:MAG: TlpA family protein disulfide reductase [Rubrivivax sp.]|nr:TlpA family protein disulfide reductase [Rubrivivax sp.]